MPSAGINITEFLQRSAMSMGSQIQWKEQKRVAPQFRIQPEQPGNGCLIKFNINVSKSMEAEEAG